MPKRILVIDDEYQITRVLKRSLGAHRYDVRTAADGESGLDLFRDFHPDLVITDLSMPELSGIEVCREIRRVSDIPIIVLSVRGEEQTKVEALDAGADDYVTKPFGMNELLARVRASLRRGPDLDEASSMIEQGDLRMDLSDHSVSIRGKSIRLTPKEFELLAFMAQNHGRVLTHSRLLGKVWGGDHTEQTEYLRVFIGNLRKKIEPTPSRPRYIVTEPWIGYRFIPGS
ncbi:MAG TPA: response regulator transcription factor [Pyrinomonadaceae bacterium]|nr:response regulator transcription factor [Pyrinomonadaceae bacterium]